MLLLLAEDDQTLADLVVHLLNKDGFLVDHARDGEEALMYLRLNNYETLILDWMMPKVPGSEVCRRARQEGYMGGILMLTAKDTLEDKVAGLSFGADDYLVKPFEYAELLARVKALVRRSSRTLQPDLVHTGRFSLDRSRKTAYRDGKQLDLSRREYQLFELLFENAGAVMPRETLIDRVWGLDGEVSNNNLDAFIRLLRKKIEVKGRPRAIVNVRGVGYKLEV